MYILISYKINSTNHVEKIFVNECKIHYMTIWYERNRRYIKIITDKEYMTKLINNFIILFYRN